MDISLESSALWLVPIVVLSALAAWWLYYIGSRFTKGQRAVLAVLRFVLFFCVGFLVLSPLLKTSENKEEKPLLIWLEDHSASMVSGADSQQVRSSLSNLDLVDRLGSRYEIQQLDFGQDLMEPSDSFSAGSTDLYEALSAVKERYYNQNVGAVVLFSDGISNSGNNPLYAAQGMGYKVYTVGFGDTTTSADIFVDRVVSNKVSYLNNNFPVEIYLKARQLSGQAYSVSLSNESGKELYRGQYTVEGDDHFRRLDLLVKAEEVGLKRFTVAVSPVAGEENTENNRRTFAIEVLNNRKKISIIAGGPHPDLAAISNALQSVEKYEVKTYIATSLPPEGEKADLYILHNPNNTILNKYLETKLPVWTFIGPSTPLPLLETKADLSGLSNSFEEIQVSMVGEFNLFGISEEELAFARDLPPLWAPFGKVSFSNLRFPLFNKKIGSVVTDEPLWFYAEQDGSRKAFTLGTGIWRWRVEDYKQNRSFELFDAYIYKSVQYLTSSSIERRFVFDIADRFNANEPIRGEARLYNPSLELTNEPELTIRMFNEENERFDFQLSRNRNTYSLNAGKLAPGIYRYRSEVTLGNEKFEAAGSFIVEENVLEASDLVARHQLLRNISRESGAEFFKSGQSEQLEEALMNNTEAKSVQLLETSTSSLISRRWIFFIFLALLGLEWALRKYFGNY